MYQGEGAEPADMVEVLSVGIRIHATLFRHLLLVLVVAAPGLSLVQLWKILRNYGVATNIRKSKSFLRDRSLCLIDIVSITTDVLYITPGSGALEAIL